MDSLEVIKERARNFFRSGDFEKAYGEYLLALIALQPNDPA